MKCLTCGKEISEYKDTIVSGFLTERVFQKSFEERIPVKLYHCGNCGFAFYDKRITTEESARLYNGYRSEEYQKQRQKYDVWYTPAINEAIGGKDEINARCGYLGEFLKENLSSPIETALDFGGDMGQFYPKSIDIPHKYVYDISGVKTVDGVTSLPTLEDARKNSYDFIMCNHVLEHIADFDDTLSQIATLGNSDTVFYFELPYDTPFIGSILDNVRFIGNPYFPLKTMIRHFINMQKLKAFAPMTEHINYFTPQALEALLSSHGFAVQKLNVAKLNIGWNDTKVISALCKLSTDYEK